MTIITLGFEVHQPYRVRRDFFWNKRMFKSLKSLEELEDYYFSSRNKEIFEKVSRKCYYPANQNILDNIDRHKGGNREFKCSYSISGILLEQIERYDPDLMETFRQLYETGRVEFLDQTYHHSLFSLHEDPSLFVEDVGKHRQAMKDLFGATPTFFENTEFLYNNHIARVVESLGYKGILTEGLERITGGWSPNHVYLAKDSNLRVLLRNYELTDDIGFRFSSRDWEGYPLTADRYSAWLAGTAGDCINLFMDYETFGEHQWKETGIFDFLSYLPGEILKYDHLKFATPTETITQLNPVKEIDVYELGCTVSWADLERDTSCWLGNSMQWAAYTYHKQLKPNLDNALLQRIWGYLSTSDHFYYMFTAGGGPGEVHSYFSPFESPNNAFLNYLAVLFDFHSRLKDHVVAGKDPFVFTDEKGAVLGVALGRKDFAYLAGNLEFNHILGHLLRGDFENWARNSLEDEKIAKAFSKVKWSKLKKKEAEERFREILKDF